MFSTLGEAVYQEEVWRFHKPDLQEIGVLVMVHVNIELLYKEISSPEKACPLSIYRPNFLQRHVWGFISASCLAKSAQNGESNVLTCNRAFGGDSKTSWALPSPSRTTSLQAVGGGKVDNHFLELTSFSDNCQAAPYPLLIFARLERSKASS